MHGKRAGRRTLAGFSALNYPMFRCSTCGPEAPVFASVASAFEQLAP
jgi:hypothetical protein